MQTGRDISGNLLNNAQNVYGGLEPQLAATAAHPGGYTPQQKAMMNTAGQQSAGGSTAGAIGQGRLYAARTRNAGGARQAIGEAVRGAGQNLSNTAVGTELANADLQQKQRQAALSGLQGLYGTQLKGGEEALGLSNEALNIANQVKPGFWQQTARTAMDDALKLATMGGGSKMGLSDAALAGLG
jgi:hypothetical protein